MFCEAESQRQGRVSPSNQCIRSAFLLSACLLRLKGLLSVQVLSLQHSGSKDSSQSQFASYWKPILSMDANFWQRWLHMHRIAILLEHDMLEQLFRLSICHMCLALSIQVCQSLIKFLILSLQAGPQTPAYSWKQWTLQHHSVSDLPLCPHIPAEGLEQLRAGGGILLCQTHIQARQQLETPHGVIASLFYVLDTKDDVYRSELVGADISASI